MTTADSTLPPPTGSEPEPRSLVVAAKDAAQILRTLRAPKPHTEKETDQ